MQLPSFLTPPSVPSAPVLGEGFQASDAAVAALMLAGLFVASYLIGSIPWGVVISRLFFGKDIRSEGSGNIGATNAARTLGKKGAAAVFLLDFGKGLLTGWLGLVCVQHLGDFRPALEGLAVALAFLGVVWGHIFSPWLGFKGGKGISAAIGNVFFLFGPVGALVEIAVFAAVVAATRHVSAGSIAAAVACPFLALLFFWGQWLAVGVVLVAALTVVWAHRGNIERLRSGTESRIGGNR